MSESRTNKSVVWRLRDWHQVGADAPSEPIGPLLDAAADLIEQLERRFYCPSCHCPHCEAKRK